MAYESRNFTYNGNVSSLLQKAPYDWRATGTFGTELLLKDSFHTDTHLLYVDEKDILAWERYLQTNDAKPAKILPNIKIIGVPKLPSASDKNSHVVTLDKLLEDLRTMAPRFYENNPPVIRRLRHKRSA
jgi:hypothetical protein